MDNARISVLMVVFVLQLNRLLKMIRVSVFVLLLVITSLSVADKQVMGNSQYQYSGQQKLSAQYADPKEYEVWGLKSEDWKAYRSLMQGHRGILSPNIDPITALGVEAETDLERRRYAEIHVQFEKQRVEKELAFQRAVDQAWSRLYPKAQLIDMDKIQQAQTPAIEQKKGRLIFFTTTESCADCEQALLILLAQVNKGRQLDIYIQSAKTDTAIRAWAKKYSVPPEQVRTRNITLNHDKGKLTLISQFTGQVPYVAVKVGNNRYQQIELP